jgi:hypothetical protein
VRLLLGPPSADQPVTVVVGFATGRWVGRPDQRPLALGRLSYRAVTRIDQRGRLVLDRRVRVYLAVAVSDDFAVVTLSALGAVRSGR